MIKKVLAASLNFLGAAITASPTHALNITAPSAYTGTAGNGITVALFNNSNRTYQQQIAGSQLSGIAIGDSITGVTYRIGSDIARPNSLAATFANWDLTLAQAANSIGSMSTTYASNMTNPILVRSGALSLAANDFIGGATSPSVNPFGVKISFTTPYIYQGGDLVFLVSHTAGSSPVGSFDALLVSTSGYGTDFRAMFDTLYNGTTAEVSNTNFAITQFTTIASVPVPFEFSPTLGIGILGGAWLVRRKLRKKSAITSKK